MGAPQMVVVEGVALPHALLSDSVRPSGNSEEGAREGDGEWVIITGIGGGGGRAIGHWYRVEAVVEVGRWGEEWQQ